MTKLTNSFSFGLKPKPPYNFELTVRKPAGWDLFTPSEVYEEGTLWTALHIDGQIVGLKLKSSGTTDSPRIVATAHLKERPTTRNKATIKKAVATKLGVDDDLSKFYALAQKDGILRHTIEDLYGMHDTQSSSLFGASILAICLQMASLKRSNQMMECVLKRHGEVVEFDAKEIQVWPLPEAIARLDIKEFATECKLGFRAKYLVQLAKILASGTFPTLEELASFPQEVARQKLQELPGIGDYSADIISPHGGFPIDVWSADVFGKLFFRREPRNARSVVERVKKEGILRWGKWSWMAFFYVAQDLEHLSRKLKMKLRLA